MNTNSLAAEQRDDLVDANHILFHQGIVDAFGHVSVRSTSDPGRFLMARNVAPGNVTHADLLEYHVETGEAVMADPPRLYLERYIHSELYKARPDVMAVVHNHSPTVIPFSVTGVPMRALFHMAAFIGDGLPNYEIRDVEHGTDLLVKTPRLGEALAQTLGQHPAALMRGHGAVVVGENIARAVGRSVYLEMSAQMQLQSIMLAGPSGNITYFDEAEVAASVAPQDYGRAWPMWRKKALAELGL
jgi:HCOMODA/2-hydroxy-3-carboxy-muconic semialdehyde decarboxylase